MRMVEKGMSVPEKIWYKTVYSHIRSTVKCGMYRVTKNAQQRHIRFHQADQ